MKSLVLVRHGATEWTADHRLTSRTDIPLSAQGILEAQALAKALADLQPARLLTSPLSRARDTAAILGDHVGVSEPEIAEELVEVDFGTYEGRITSPPDPELESWWRVRGSFAPSGVEPFEGASERVGAILERDWEGVAIAVSHGVILRLLIASVVGIPLGDFRTLELAAGSYSVLSSIGSDPRLETLNFRVMHDG